MAKRPVMLVIVTRTGETSVVEAAGNHSLTVEEIETWRDKFRGGAESALRSKC